MRVIIRVGEVSSASVPWPFSQLPAPSAAGLIGVTAGQAVVTAAQLFSAVIGGGGERRLATSDLRSNSGQDRGGGLGGRTCL